MQINEKVGYYAEWTIFKYADDEAYKRGDCFEQITVPRNMLLNEGIQTALDLIIGAGGTAYNNANARLGVGDSAGAEAATQTDLQAATNKTYKAMEASYPSRTNQTLMFRSVFGSADANYAWNEFCVDNGAAGAKTLNRKVSAQGTKAAGQTWTLDLTITLS